MDNHQPVARRRAGAPTVACRMYRPGSVWKDSVRTVPNGEEQVREVPHRLGDYFAEIRTLPASRDSPESFRLVFCRRPDAGRFWKDLMVNVLEQIRTAPQKATVELESKADVDEPRERP